MSTQTKIEWTTYSASPWEGCTKVSPGCLNCYAKARDDRHLHEPVSHWGKGAPRRKIKGFEATVKAWDRKAHGFAACDGCEWRGFVPSIENTRPCPFCRRLESLYSARPTVFPSLCDWLDDEVPIEWLAEFLRLIHETPNLTWLLLTKRPENFRSRLVNCASWAEILHIDAFIDNWLFHNSPPANVWIGASVEDQPHANERIPALLKIPARVRFLSAAPLLGPISLRDFLPDPTADQDTSMYHFARHPEDGIHWVIIGGESGPGARPCSVEWIRDIVRQCDAAGVKPFVKQLGARPVQDLSAVIPEASDEETQEDPMAAAQWDIHRHQSPMHLKHPKGGDPSEWPADLRRREFPEGLR